MKCTVCGTEYDGVIPKGHYLPRQTCGKECETAHKSAKPARGMTTTPLDVMEIYHNLCEIARQDNRNEQTLDCRYFLRAEYGCTGLLGEAGVFVGW